MDSEASSSESNEHKILFEAHAFLLERMLNYERIEPTDLPLALLAKITNYFSDDMLIGHGGFAVVYKGRLGRGKMVAVKKLSEKIDMDETKYNQEVDCLMRVKHRNIVRFLGYCANTHVKRSEYQGKFVMADVRHRLLCFEYLSEGSLRNYISDASCGLDWAKRYEIIKGICEGLSYLHEKRIVHLDLKPENILLNEDMVPKISDFGLSRCFDEDQTRAMASKLLGSTGYMAPEFYDKVITTKSDIYSLGVIFTEILTGQKGYSTQKNVVECWRNRSEGSLSETLLEQVSVCAEISIDCMNFDPTKRPDVRSIIHKLAGTERTNDEFSKFGTTTSLMVQPSRNNLHLPRGKLPVPSFNADAILEDKSSTRRFAMISSARANCTRVVSAVIVKIDTVLADETAKAVVEKHHGEAVELQNKIRNIRERLTFMAKMSKVCMSSDAWCEKMRNLAYRVEDMMDKYFYYSFKMKDESFLKKIITESHNADVFSEIADELVKVDMEIENIKKINDMRSPSSLDVLDDLIEKERQRSQVSFQEFLKHEDLVGIEDNRRMLTEWLYFDELQNTVITVSGMGGLGKTVLVADVYKHEMINFPSHAWITVSQTYNVDALLRKLLREIDYIEYLSAHIEDMDVYELKVEIRRRLKDRDCLIVLDDVWSKDVYFQMFDGLQNMQGIRIIITTRKNHVAALAPPTRRLDLKPLSNTHAFNLFCRITLHDDECPKELEQCATSILARCLGLPSAIVSIGRLLSSGPHTCDFWGRMYYEARNELPDNDIMRAILEPSYYDLSEDLKNCFLYCSLFPEDYQFSCESLVRMWVAEGFVLSRGNHTPEEVAEGNLMELIDCNLLLAMQNDEQGRVVSCKMHGILRDLAHAVAKKEKFHFTNDYYSLTRMKRDTVRRLSLCRWYDERIIKFRFPHLRTLVSLGTVSSSTATLSSILSESIYLTVLELQDSEVTEVPESLGILFNLRYIGLRRTKVKSLPDTIVKLSNLQTLDIKETKIQNLPRRMGNVKKLRHLFADRYADNQENFPCIFGMQPPKQLLNSSESPYIFGVQPPNDLLSLEYLETLETVQSTSDLPDQLKKLWRLRSVWIDNINTADCETLFATLSNLPLLSSLLLCARDGNEELRITKLSRVKLRRLITIGQWAPGTLGCSAFSVGRYLNHLAISWCYLGRDSLNMLAREVPCLTYLKLSNVYGAEILDVTKGSFPELKTLVLEYMDDVDNLVLRYGALPMIEALYIVSLTKLDKVPHGLESLAHLKKLWLLNLHTNFRAQWHKNGMHNKMQHVTEIRI